MRKFLFYIFFVVSFALVSCDRDEAVVSVDEEVNLELTMSVPQLEVSLKGLDDPWDTDLTDWTRWDLYTDGRDFYGVTILLIEESTGNLVGYRDIRAGSDYVDENNGFYDPENNQVLGKTTDYGTDVKVSFLYDSPQDGRTIEKLRRGRYLVLAVANYRGVLTDVIDGVSKEYSGLEGAIGSSQDIDTSFGDLMDKIKNGFDSETGIQDFKNTELYTDIWTFNIVADANHLCYKQPQPLTAVKYIELVPGDNTFNFGLERTYVRVRVEVENNSATSKLIINNFDFCDWFTQRAVYLFNDPTDNSRNYDISSTGLNTYKKSPILEIECDGTAAIADGDKSDSYTYQGNAIISFKEAITIPVQSSAVIFDGYVFGSKLDPTNGDGDTYQYSLDMVFVDNERNGVTYKTPPTLASETPYTTAVDIKEGEYYLIKNVRATDGGYLYVSSDNYLESGSKLDDIKSELMTKDMTHVWTLEAVGDDNYYLKNILEGSERYISSNESPVQTVVTNPSPFTIADCDFGDGVEIRRLNDGSKCLNENNTNKQYTWWYSTIDDYMGNLFVFYPVKQGEELPAEFDSAIDLELIDPVTAQVYPVTNVKRNDFINILVSASYSPSGHEFQVENMVSGWTQKDMEIEFH